MGLDAMQEFSKYKNLTVNHECRQGNITSFNISKHRDDEGYVTTIDYEFSISGQAPNRFVIKADDDGIPVLDRLDGVFGRNTIAVFDRLNDLFGENPIYIGAIYLPVSGTALGFWIKKDYSEIEIEDMKDWCYDFENASLTL